MSGYCKEQPILGQFMSRSVWQKPKGAIFVSRLDYISLGLIFFSVITITLGIIKVHTYPGKVAKARNHPQEQAIEVLSLLGLIIFPLWMAALVWAYSGAIVGNLYAKNEHGKEVEQPADKEEKKLSSTEKKADQENLPGAET